MVRENWVLFDKIKKYKLLNIKRRGTKLISISMFYEYLHAQCNVNLTFATIFLL